MPSTPFLRRSLSMLFCSSDVEPVKKRKSTSTLVRLCAALLQPYRTIDQNSFVVLVTKARRSFLIAAPLAVPLLFLLQPWQTHKIHKARRKK